MEDFLVIDGDAIPYMIGYTNREHTEVEIVLNAVDQFMNEFLILTQAPKFIGIISHSSSKCFRYEVYKYKPYKGNRVGEKEPWIVFWEPIIRKHLEESWGFVLAPVWMETDDIVAMLAENNGHAIICSPDKDLKQIAGRFYNYVHTGTEKHKGLEIVSKQQAEFNFYYQILTGDTTDNINGCTGMGDVKAKKLLEETSQMMWNSAVKLAFQKQYGPYYGNIIYEETVWAIKMMIPSHPLWERLSNTYGFNLQYYIDAIKNTSEYVRSIRRETE